MADSVAPTMTKAGAVVQRVALGQRLRLFFDRYDLLLSPTMPIPAAKKSPALPILPSRPEPELMKEEGMANKEQKRKTREAKKPKQKKKASPKEPASKVQQVTRT